MVAHSATLERYGRTRYSRQNIRGGRAWSLRNVLTLAALLALHERPRGRRTIRRGRSRSSCRSRPAAPPTRCRASSATGSSRKWGQPVIIENKPGAAGNIGAEQVANAEPDGYTLLSAPPPPLVINHNLYPKLGFDPTKFVPIVIMGRVPNALVVHPQGHGQAPSPNSSPMPSANPGKVTAATQGNGTTSHLTSEMFQMMANVKFQHVPYRGSAPALQDLVAGNVDIMFDNLGVSLALVKGGKLKLIAVATPKRMAALPDVPTIAETLPGFESAAWFAIVAPPKTPQRSLDKINADINEALRSRKSSSASPTFRPSRSAARRRRPRPICARRSSAGTR